MANKHRGEVVIHLDKKRKLKFNTLALVELEDKLGHSLAKLDTEEVGIKTIVSMLWASLLHENPDITFEETAELIDHSSLDVVSDKVRETLELAFGDSKEQPKNAKGGPSGVGVS